MRKEIVVGARRTQTIDPSAGPLTPSLIEEFKHILADELIEDLIHTESVFQFIKWNINPETREVSASLELIVEERQGE